MLLSGAVIGVVAGLGAIAIGTRSLPEFTEPPASVPLSYAPPGGPLALAVAGTVLVLLVVAAVASRVLLAGARPEQLRQAQA